MIWRAFGFDVSVPRAYFLFHDMPPFVLGRRKSARMRSAAVCLLWRSARERRLCGARARMRAYAIAR